MTTYMDAEFIEALLEGSYERHVAVVSETVRSKTELFGEGAEVIGTFGEHAIVVNPDGRAWKVPFEKEQREGLPLGGIIALGSPEKVDIPTKTDQEMSAASKDASANAVDTMLDGDDEEALESARGLMALAQEGVALTLQTVEADVGALMGSKFRWREDLNAKRDSILEFVGDTFSKDGFYEPKYNDLGVAGGVDGSIAQEAMLGMMSLVDFFGSAVGRLGVVSEAMDRIPDANRLEIEGFVSELQDDADEMLGYAQDALATSEADSMIMARVYDMLAGFTEDVLVGVLFSEKLISSFDKAGE